MNPAYPKKEPRRIGKFNYICFAKDYFNVLFTPFAGATCVLIYRNLPEKEAKELIAVLNAELDRTDDNVNFATNEDENN